jgi:hypothetical protein
MNYKVALYWQVCGGLLNFLFETQVEVADFVDSNESTGQILQNGVKQTEPQYIPSQNRTVHYNKKVRKILMVIGIYLIV